MSTKQVVTREEYVTCDGTRYDTEEKAIAHEWKRAAAAAGQLAWRIEQAIDQVRAKGYPGSARAEVEKILLIEMRGTVLFLARNLESVPPESIDKEAP